MDVDSDGFSVCRIRSIAAIGRCVIFIDERADEAQHAALSEIVSGKAGPGGPFELFVSTYTEPPSVRFGRFSFEREGRRGIIELNDIARVQVGPSWTRARRTLI
jgi:hypothetical protein